jgi:hypothetical protein
MLYLPKPSFLADSASVDTVGDVSLQSFLHSTVSSDIPFEDNAAEHSFKGAAFEQADTTSMPKRSTRSLSLKLKECSGCGKKNQPITDRLGAAMKVVLGTNHQRRMERMRTSAPRRVSVTPSCTCHYKGEVDNTYFK